MSFFWILFFLSEVSFLFLRILFNLLCWIIFSGSLKMLMSKISFRVFSLHLLLFFGEIINPKTPTSRWPQSISPDISSILHSRLMFITPPEPAHVLEHTHLTLCDGHDGLALGLHSNSLLVCLSSSLLVRSSEAGTHMQYFPGCKYWVSVEEVQVAQSCLTLCDPTDYTVHGILQARILEWVDIPFSRGSSQPRD